MRRLSLLAVLSLLLSLLVTSALGAAAAGRSTPSRTKSVQHPAWAPASSAAIHPGLMTYTGPDQCTSNFVFTDRTGAVYLGQAAHCSSTSASNVTNGCQADSLPLGTPVTITGAAGAGRLAYSSWLAMHAAKESDAGACAYNDLALIRLSREDSANVNPSVPHFGGPTGINTAGLLSLDTVYAYGNSGLRGGAAALRPKRGLDVVDQAGGWVHTVWTATPGIPGDSGCPYLDAAGRALGVLSTVNLYPYATTNDVGDVGHELAYARTHGMPGLELALGTESFTAPLF